VQCYISFGQRTRPHSYILLSSSFQLSSGIVDMIREALGKRGVCMSDYIYTFRMFRLHARQFLVPLNCLCTGETARAVLSISVFVCAITWHSISNALLISRKQLQLASLKDGLCAPSHFLFL